MGVSSAQYGSLFHHNEQNHTRIVLDIARETKKDMWEIGELLDLIRQKVEAKVTSEQVKIHAVEPSDSVTTRGSNYTASSLV